MKGYIALPADPYDLQERGQCEPQQIGRMLLENYATRFLINGRRVIFTSVLVGDNRWRDNSSDHKYGSV